MGKNSSNIVRAMWHGSPLSVFENLCLRSFLKCEHEVELYAYREMEVPVGVRLCDANAIFPEAEIFTYQTGPSKGSFTAFSNLFRYKLLYENGGIWVDLDTLCLHPFHQLPTACAGREDEGSIGTGVMKFPARHPLMRAAYEKATALGRNINFGDAGPNLLTRLLEQGDYSCEVLPIPAFNPLHWTEAARLIKPEELSLCEERTRASYSVHWWNTYLRLIRFQKEALPPKGSFLHERAKFVFDEEEPKAWPYETVKAWMDDFESDVQ